ncbi:hypothetical protein UlMin_035376 [Ulmus minor]
MDYEILGQGSETFSSEEEYYFNFRNCTSLEEEFVGILMEREVNFGLKNDQSLVVYGERVKCARLEAITWILSTRAVFGFRLQTAYLSMIYFDRFLSKRSIDDEKIWVIPLLSVACLSLAAKMEEIKIPGISEYQLEDYNFGSKAIERMELLVLNTLEWKMGSITPFAYLHYFISKLCLDSSPSNVLSRTAELILATMAEINMIDHRASTIAMAATLVTLEEKLTRTALELKLNSISHCKSLKIEEVFSCYNLMKELKKDRVNDGVETSSVTNLFCNERKRSLASVNGDQNHEMEEEKKRLC